MLVSHHLVDGPVQECLVRLCFFLARYDRKVQPAKPEARLTPFKNKLEGQARALTSPEGREYSVIIPYPPPVYPVPCVAGISYARAVFCT